MAPRDDIAPSNPVRFPDTGLGRGWEPAAILVITLLLLSFGLVTLYSTTSPLAQHEGRADYYYVLQQIVAAVLGLATLATCARMPYRWWRGLAWPAVAVAWVLLMICVLPGTEAIAPRINGARRWVRLGVSVQPSEIAMFALVVWTAGLAVRKQKHFRNFRRGMVPFLVVWAALLIPVALGPNLSAAALIGIACALVVFVAGGRIGHFVMMGLAISPILWVQLRVGFRWERLLVWRNLGTDPSGVGYQVRQSLIALGSGGMTGVGFAEGRQKAGFLPEPHTDFIFSVIGEEWGFVGVFVLTSLYLALILLGFRVARRAKDAFGEFLAVGLTSLIALHAVLHMGVGLGVVPSTGLPLPLVSFGRSNLVVMLAAIGVLMSVARGRAPARGRRG